MAKRTTKPRKKKQLAGADEFAGPDAEKEAIEKAAQAKAEQEKAEEEKKKGDNGGPILDRDAWARATNESIAEDLEIERLQEQIAECRGRLSSIRKVAKSCGVDWDAVKNYRKKAARIRHGEMGEIVTEIRREVELGRLMDCPLYTQYGLFPDEPEQGGAAAAKPGMDAELQGQAAWRNKEPRENNAFKPGTEDYVAWDRGWTNAEAAALQQLGRGNGAGAGTAAN